MEKNTITKGVLLLIVLVVLSLGFTGCGTTIITTTPTYSTTGTVYITINTWDDYSIYIDGVYQGYATNGYYTVYGVPIGYHTFVADGWWYYGSTYQYISSGTNYITIYTY